jgi:hypothetical protein
MQKRSSTGWLVADFFTHRHRISGRADVRQKKLADQLNDHTTSFLQLEEVYISNIEHPAEIGTHHATSILRKDNITAIVVSRQEDGLPREHTYGSYFGSYLRKVFITVHLSRSKAICASRADWTCAPCLPPAQMISSRSSMAK